MDISEEAKDILQEGINIGIGRAAVSFSEILKREIKLTFPTLLIFNLEELKRYLKRNELVEYVSVSQAFSGGLVGRGIVSFPLEDGKTLVNRLLENPSTVDPDFGILERETIVEVGNVLINSVACSISDMLEVETSYEMPEIAIANRTISVEEESEDNIYCLGQGKFSVEGIEIHGNLMLILTYNRLEHIIAKLSYS